MNRTTTHATLLSLLVLLLAGCNIAAPVFFAVHGPGRVVPGIDLDPEATTVVFVDDPSSKVSQRRMRVEIASEATTVLLNKGIVKDMIDPRSIMNAAIQERHGEKMSITELGRSVGADVVIYAAVTEFSLSADKISYMPTCSLAVKVIDTREGKRLWPDTPQGCPVLLRPKHRTGQPPKTPSLMLKAEMELAKEAGMAIAQLFYRHDITESVSR